MPSKPKTHRMSDEPTQQHQSTETRSSTQLGYDRRWRKARLAFLTKHPLCVDCEREGLIVPATVVDHKIPHKGNMRLFWDQANWQSQCDSHHSAKTATKDGGFGRSVTPMNDGEPFTEPDWEG